MNILNRSLAPSFNKLTFFDFPKVTSLKLKNSSSLHILDSGTQPLLRVEFVFLTGHFNENVKGISSFAFKMLFEGSIKYTSVQISQMIASWGGFVETVAGNDRSMITFYVLSDFFENLMDLFVEVLNNSTFNESEFKNLNNIAVQNIKVNFEKNGYIASGYFRQQLFGSNHPYGLFQNADQVSKMTQVQCYDFYQKNIKNSLSDIFITGFGADKYAQIFEDKYAVCFNNFVPIKEKIDFSIEETDSKFNIEKPNALQTSIRIGKRTIKKNHQDFIKLLVTNEILGGYFGSRLMKNIREDKGFTYGIGSNVASMKMDAYFAISTDVKKENKQETVDEIFKEINLLQTVEVSTNELETVKKYMQGSFLNSFNTSFSLMDKFKGVYFHDLDYQFYQEYFNQIDQISSKDILQIANQYLQIDEMKIITIG